MNFSDLFAQQAAPIEDRAAIPQTPNVMPAPMVNPNPPPPGPPPAPPPNANLVGRWSNLINRITQPDVMGPLQTFLAAAAAPLQPGETLGARLGYAGTLMQLHRSMLQENARLAPQLAEERELKLREMRGKIAQTEAATEASRLAGRRAQQEMSWQDETKLQRIDLLDQQVAAAKAQGKEAEAKRLEAERERLHLEKWGDRAEQAKIDLQRAQAGMYNRSPRVGDSPAENKAAVKAELENQYEIQIWAPYVEWVRAQPTASKESVTFNQYLKENPTAAALYKVWSREYVKAGGKLEIRRESMPKGPQEGQDAPLGTPQNPITRPKPGAAAPQQSGTFPPGLADRIPR